VVDVDGIGRFPQEIEAAVYFCCLEGLQNVSKYAAASSVTISVTADDGSLTFCVEDDGAGFDPARVVRGAGLTNMADRLDALGGELTVTSTPGRGTRVTGSLPVAGK
jgi:signal transduction histidine kinase